VLCDALLTILGGTIGLAVAVRGSELATLGGVLFTLRQIEVRTVGFAIVPVRCTLKALVMRIHNRVAVSKEIFAIQVDLAVLDGNPLVAAPPLRFVLIVA
jgi:hypothetical protein